MDKMTKAERKAISRELDASLEDIEEINQELNARTRASHGGGQHHVGLSPDSSISILKHNSKQGGTHSKIIQECRTMYRTTGVVKNIIDLMADFATEGIDIIHPDEEQNKFYKAWMSKINMPNRVEHIIRSYFKDGNVAIYAIDGKITKGQVTKLIRATIKNKKKADARIKEIEDSLTEMEQISRAKDDPLNVDIKVKRNTIPVRYEIYNPMHLKKIGPQGFKRVLFQVDDSIVKLVKKTGAKTPIEREILDKLPKSFIKEIKAAKKSKQVFVTLGLERNDPNLTMIHYKKDDSQDWADPIVFSILDDLKFKKTLRAADGQAARNIIDALTVIKIGDTANGFAPSKKQFAKLASLLKTPTNTKTILWGDQISIETAYPPVDKILGNEKYEAVDNDILAGFGVSEVIVNGKGGNYSSSFLSVRTLLERLETGRNEVKNWLLKEVRRIMKAFGWTVEPHIRFGHMSLRNEATEKALLLQLADRNIISSETVLQQFGENKDVEFERMKREKEKMDDAGMERNSPISAPVESNPESKTPRGKDQKGRPKNTEEVPQDVDRETEPTGQASIDVMELMTLKDLGLQIYNNVEEIVTKEYCKVKEVSNKKSLSKVDKEELDGIIFKVFSNMSVDSIGQDGIVHSLFANIDDVKLDGRTSEIFESLNKKNKDVASARQIREMRASAFAIANIK